MRICIFDFETSSADPQLAVITEIGAVFYDTEEKTYLYAESMLCRDPIDPPLSDENVKITGITNSMYNGGFTTKLALQSFLSKYYDQAHWICAHNGIGYDKIILERACKQYGIELKDKPMIDTMYDLPMDFPSKKLNYIATELGFLNPFPHRALPDALTLMRILQQFEFSEIAKRASSPTLTIQAVVGFENKDRAAKAGYRWEPSTKRWLKSVKAMDMEKEKKALEPFNVVQVG